MREISLDTETTGFHADKGDRIVEIGCVELWNHVPTGNVYHAYFNPERDMSEGAAQVTGLTDAFLRDKPLFHRCAQDFLDFVKDDPLVIHNAEFDIKFLNMELGRVSGPEIDRRRVVDTLAMARKRFPGAQVSLDALCRRFSIDLSVREKHGALLDAELLALVYLELRGGRQPHFALARTGGDGRAADLTGRAAWGRAYRPRGTADEAEAHARFVAGLGDAALWTEMGDDDPSARS